MVPLHPRTHGSARAACQTPRASAAALSAPHATLQPGHTGTGHVVLTLGALGAALFSIASPLDAADEAAAQAGSSPAAEELLLPPGSSSSSGCGAPDEVGGASASALAAVAHARRRQQEVEVVQLRALPAEVASVNGAGGQVAARPPALAVAARQASLALSQRCLQG